MLKHRDRGIRRRDFLALGSLALGGLTLPDVLRARAGAAAEGRARNDTSVLLVYLGGGSSHLDMWDLKPDAPAEIRGEFKPIDSSLPGVRVCEHLPHAARQMHRCSLLRSVSHRDNEHGSASHYVLTGYEPLNANPVNEAPSFASIVAKECGSRRPGLPGYVAIPEPPRSGTAGYLGMNYNPFAVGGDPGLEDYQVRNLSLPGDVNLDRLDDRRHLMAKLDAARRAHDRCRLTQGHDTFLQKAFDMVTSDSVQAAFDLRREDTKTRDRYGRTTFGQGLLLGRRLVEAGVTFVTVKNNGWDTHQDNFNTMKKSKLPEFDRPWGALLDDLFARGLDRRVLVVLLTEFGRSWFISSNGGREHWAPCNSVLFAGGGLKTGQVIGASDAKAAYPKERPTSPEDLIATIYHVLGVNPETTYANESGRPVKALNTGKPIKELVG